MVLETVWFFLWGLLWAVFFMTDGYDFGVGTLMPFLAKEEKDKRVMVNSLGPLWDGNEVWLVTAGGATFAAFPKVYAVMFSSLYTPLMLILFALIIRGVSFEFRGKVDSSRWRRAWDTGIFVGSSLPAVLFGVTFANIFAGLPIDQDGLFHGNLLSLLHPYGLLGGLFFLSLFLLHGSLWITMKADGDLHARSLRLAHRLWFVLLAVAVLFLAASALATPLYDNYIKWPVLSVAPLGAIAALLLSKLFLRKGRFVAAWLASAATIVCCTFFGVIGLYPNMLPSSIAQEFSLTAHNASSSQLTLTIMLAVVAIFIPIVIAYQFWAYRLFHGKVQNADMVY